MIQLKIKRTNSVFGSWKCEELGKVGLNDPMGVNRSIEEAIEDFLNCYKKLKGFTPNYKWS